jgi:glycosyltransferase involved in cell wall biosynthesis
MRALFVSSQFLAHPGRDVDGVFQRMSLFMEALGCLYVNIDVLMYPSPQEMPDVRTFHQIETHLSCLAGRPVSLFLAPRGAVRDEGLASRIRRRLRSLIDLFETPLYDFMHLVGPTQIVALQSCLSRQPNLIFAHRLPIIAPILKSGLLDIPLFFDLDDIEHRKLARHSAYLSGRAWSRTLLSCFRTFLAERRAITVATCTYVCSEGDRIYLEKLLSGRGRIEVVPNAVSLAPFLESPGSRAMLFVGNLGYEPNLMAADELISDIWPMVRSLVPDAILFIVGAHPERLRCYCDAPEGVKIEGFVHNLEALYRIARVVCCPIRIGSGTRVKILAAAAHGRPVVSTHRGAEGLDLHDGAEILIRDKPEAFAQACASLLINEALCLQIGAAAQQKVVRQYLRGSVVERICTSMKTKPPIGQSTRNDFLP